MLFLLVIFKLNKNHSSKRFSFLLQSQDSLCFTHKWKYLSYFFQIHLVWQVIDNEALAWEGRELQEFHALVIKCTLLEGFKTAPLLVTITRD